MSPVSEASPDAKSLDAAWESAMGAPARPKEPPPPPAVDPEAPHGRDHQGVPLQPYGLNKDGSVRKSAAGRPGKDDKPRTTAPAPGPGPGKPAAVLAEPGQYTQALADSADGVWLAMSALGKAAPDIPLIGKSLAGKGYDQKIQAQAQVWYLTKDRAVAAVSLAAEHNAAAARFAARFEGGDITWMITCMSLVMPILSLSGMVWAKDADQQLAESKQPSLAELADRNEQDLAGAVRKMIAQAEAAANEQPASQPAQPA